jgi:hypothetical protein
MVLATIVAAIVLPSADTASGDGADDEARAKEEPLTKSTSSSFEEATDQVEEEEERTTQEIPIVAALLAIVLANFANGTWAVEPLFLKVSHALAHSVRHCVCVVVNVASAQEFFGWGPNEFTAILMIYNVGLLTAQLLVVVPATKLLGLRNVGLLSCSLLSLGRRAWAYVKQCVHARTHAHVSPFGHVCIHCSQVGHGLRTICFHRGHCAPLFEHFVRHPWLRFVVRHLQPTAHTVVPPKVCVDCSHAGTGEATASATRLCEHHPTEYATA